MVGEKTKGEVEVKVEVEIREEVEVKVEVEIREEVKVEACEVVYPMAGGPAPYRRSQMSDAGGLMAEVSETARVRNRTLSHGGRD